MDKHSITKAAAWAALGTLLVLQPAQAVRLTNYVPNQTPPGGSGRYDKSDSTEHTLSISGHLFSYLPSRLRVHVGTSTTDLSRLKPGTQVIYTVGPTQGGRDSVLEMWVSPPPAQ